MGQAQASVGVALVSPCGWGNLGDAAIVDALIQGIRRRFPNPEILAYTLNPADSTRRHGVEAHECLGYSLPTYRINFDGAGGAEAGGAEGEGEAPAGGRAVASAVR